MEARIVEEIKSAPAGAKLAELDQFLARLTSPEQTKLLSRYSEMRKQFSNTEEDKSLEVAEKYMVLLVTLNSGKLNKLMHRLGANILMKLHVLCLFSNVADVMQKGFEILQEDNKPLLETDILSLCAVASSPENFNAMCERLGLEDASEMYAIAMMRANEQSLMPIAPLYMAAYSGNLSLLQDMCASLGRDKMLALEEESGMSLLHYAALGGDVATIHYLCNGLKFPLSQVNSLGMTPFSYTALSNHPEAVAAFIDMGYKPTTEDTANFHALFNNDITTLRKGYNAHLAAHDMPFILREQMGDPTIKAVKAARQAIKSQLNSTLEMLNDMIRVARDGDIDLEMSRLLVQDAASAMRNEALSYSHLTNIDSRLAIDIESALERVDEKVKLLDKFERATVLPRSRAPQPSSASSSSSLSSTSKMMLSDADWQRRINENVARQEEMKRIEKKEALIFDDYPDMLDLKYEDLFMIDQELVDFASAANEKDEDDEKEEKKSPRLF